MLKPLDPFRFLLIAVAAWMTQHQLQVIDYVREENCVLRQRLGGRRLRLSDDQRRRLPAKGKLLGRRVLAEVAPIVTPETLLAWHRKLIAQKSDVSSEIFRDRTVCNGKQEAVATLLTDATRYAFAVAK